MTMPLEFTMVRHGESEINVIQNAKDKKIKLPYADIVEARPDWQQRLTIRGELQAENAREWIDRNLGGVASYDMLYTSSFIRARETAARISGDSMLAGWITDDRITERDWGHFGTATEEERMDMYDKTRRLHKASPYFARLDGGESRFDVSPRYRDFQGTLR